MGEQYAVRADTQNPAAWQGLKHIPDYAHLWERIDVTPEPVLERKLRFEQVPISMMSRAAGETKKPARLAYPLGVFRVIISTWLR